MHTSDLGTNGQSLEADISEDLGKGKTGLYGTKVA